MATSITVTRKLEVPALLTINDAEFKHWYSLGVWWAMYGDEQGKGQYEDRYLIDNIASGIAKGLYLDLTNEAFPHLGFYLGMIHGGNIDPGSHELNMPSSIVKLTDFDFTKGYQIGLKEERHLTDALFIALVHRWALNVPIHQVLAYELGKWIGNLALALKPGTLLETASQAVTHPHFSRFSLAEGVESLSSKRAGVNKLIQDGARPIMDVRDILEALNLFMIPQHIEMQAALPDNDEERVLLKLISHEPCHIDELIRASGLATTTVSATLAMMEPKGMVKQVGGMQYVLAR